MFDQVPLATAYDEEASVSLVKGVLADRGELGDILLTAKQVQDSGKRSLRMNLTKGTAVLGRSEASGRLPSAVHPGTLEAHRENYCATHTAEEVACSPPRP